MNKILSLILLFILVSCNGGSPTTTPGFGSDDQGQHTTVPTAADVTVDFTTIVGGASVVANGTSTALVTVTLKTAANVAVPNVVPTFSATDTGSNNIYGACTSSNASGVSTCTIASRTPEIKDLQLTSPVSLTGGRVTFLQDNVDMSSSYIHGDDNILADGTTVSNIRIKLIDNSGNPFTGVPDFQATDTGSTNSYGTCSPLDQNGESVCTLTSTKAETKQLEILSPAYFPGSVIHFTAGAISAAQSTITTTSTPVSDGVSAALLKITLKDAFSNPVAGSTPTYSATNTGSQNVYGPCSASNSVGESFCSMTSRKAEVKTLSITAPVAVAGGTVTFSPGAAYAANCTITGSSNVVADGVAFSNVQVTLQDAGTNPIPGVVPTFTATDTGNDNVYGTCSSSDASGISTCKLYSLSPESKALRITSPLFKTDASVVFNSPGMNIMVPIDLIDRGVSSNTAAIIFDRSLYPLTTTDYVGTSTDYYFEIVASNANVTNPYTVNLLGNANAVLATITIPASTTAYTRFRSPAITMPAGTNQLKIRVNATAAANNVIVLAGKLLIKQVAATKTKLWIPLSHYDHSGYANTAILSVFQNALTTHTNNLTYTAPWNRNDSLYTELDSSAYKFEALLASNNAAGNSSAILYNNTDSVTVAGSPVSVTGTTIAWASAPLADSSSFANSKNYEVRLKSNNAAYTAYLFKAGISVSLTNLSKIEIANRLYMRRSSTTSAMLSGGRIMWEAADYAHPKAFMDIYGSVTAGGSASRELDDMATSDNNVATPIVVTDSVLNLTTTSDYLRTPELTLTDGNRVIVYDRVNSGTSTLTATWLVIKSTLR